MATLEQLIECEISDFFAGFGHPGEPETPEEMQSQLLARVMPLLAWLDQEPVGEVILGDYDDCGDYPDAKVVCTAAQGQADWNNFRNGTKLYAAPQLPQPVVVVPDEIESTSGSDADDYYCDGWNACRAAMLQGAEPVSQPYTLREGLAAIRSLGPIDAGKIQAERDALNEPVQDWIPCSERMPPCFTGVLVAAPWPSAPDGYAMKWATNCPWHPDADENGWIIPGASWKPTHWMPLPAAPQQEVKP